MYLCEASQEKIKAYVVYCVVSSKAPVPVSQIKVHNPTWATYNSTLFKFLSRKIEFSKESKRKNLIDIEDKYLSTLSFISAKVSCKILTTAKRIQKSLLRPAIHKFMDPGTIGLDSHT